jgi:hypothetical protein
MHKWNLLPPYTLPACKVNMILNTDFKLLMTPGAIPTKSWATFLSLRSEIYLLL